MTQNAPIGNLAICTCPLGLCDQIKVLNSPLCKSEKNPDIITGNVPSDCTSFYILPNEKKFMKYT